VRVAIVVPLIKKVHGNRLSFCLARGLARSNEVTVYAETALDRLVPEVEKQVAPAGFRALRTTSSPRSTNLELLSHQLRRGPDRRLSDCLHADHRTKPFDWVVVFANEGHWIASYVASWSESNRPRTALALLDPIEQIFLLARDRPLPIARQLLMPLYPVLHRIESQRIRRFDRVFPISRWVSELGSFLYGITPADSLAALDSDLFTPPAQVDDSTPYVAVPTMSLRPSDGDLVRAVARGGIPLTTFGPKEVSGVPHRGFLPDRELVSFLAGARATLFLFDYEALGLLPLESLAVGTPVVTLPSGGPFIELRENPFVSFANDVEGLTRLCNRFLREPRAVRDPDRIRASVREYFASEVSVRWARSLERVAERAKF